MKFGGVRGEVGPATLLPVRHAEQTKMTCTTPIPCDWATHVRAWNFHLNEFFPKSLKQKVPHVYCNLFNDWKTPISQRGT